MTYSYDLLDRLVEKSYHETGKPDFTIRYTYNAESQLARLRYEEDGETVGSYAFEYDSLGRLIRSTAMDENGSVTQRTEHLYDAFNRLSGQSWTLGSQTYSERYAYSDGEKGDGSLTSMTAATGDSLEFGYDALKRLNRVTAKSGSSIIMNTAYAYRDVSWNRGSAQVEFHNVRLGSDSGMLLEGKKYSYDKAGNLVMISESTGDFNKLVEYTYDSQNQLTSEAYYKSGEAEAYITYNYTYDTAGNLLTVSQKKGNTTTLLQTYTYGDAQWHDLLTAVNGQAITYDASGNPLSYGGWSFGWQNGRQLKTASKTSDGKTETLEYAYDADGIRTSKTYTVETFTQVPDYTVTFQADGATVKTMTVEDGYVLKDSDYPAVPSKSGYTGEWVKYTTAVHSNVTVQAKYTAVVAKYTVTFKADNTVVKTMTVEDGYTLKDSDYPAVPTKTGYTGEWVKYTSAIHSNVTVQAKYTAVSTDHTVTFKANGKTVKTMVVPDGYVLQDSDYPPIPPRVGYKGSWSKVTTAIRRDTVIYASYMPNGGGIVIPTQPTSPGEIMSGSEGEPVEADVPAEDETVSPQGTHVTGTQTVTHEYLTLNGKVARETIRTNNSLTAVLDFVYDDAGRPFALRYSTNGTSFQTYYYVLNLQGDVVKLIHYIPGFEYESVATYEYDAWGNIVSSSGRLAEINPLRYRGYYYDSETGFYYLQSRYYDPANRRFINADGLISFDCGFSGLNMYSYCGNCPVACSDPNGASFISDLIEKAKDLLRYVLHAGNDLARMHGIDTAAVGAAVLEMEKDENGIYHARPDCWQQYAGYTDLYDYAFDAGTSMKRSKFPFKYAGEEYILWLWVGDYINLGAGAEAGIYYGGEPFWLVDTDLAMRMSMDVYYKDENIISYSDTTWWLTGFNPEYLNVSAGDMSVVYTIVFSDPGMFSAFCAANGKYWNCNPMNFSATYRFG
ncbi:MAG: RHS repeat-associated core domain-containing protein [Oscillospiraceae bacterium]|nr:RHS repeat-associated core domain-containing protein [Oscillospiraceae bacterium]